MEYSPPKKTRSGRAGDVLDLFRLRNFVRDLAAMDELAIIDEPVDLAGISGHLHGQAKAVLFRQAGPEKAEIIGNVMGSRKRLAAAFGTDEAGLLGVVLERLGKTYPLAELSAGEAPVQQVILHGEEADLTKLPVPFQHGFDGGPYISAGLDYARDPHTGWANIGARRLMVRGRREAGIDMNTPSDLKAIYEGYFRQGKSMPLAFALGCHPIDHLAAAQRLAMDELALLASLRGMPLAVVKCVSNDLLVPADAEMIIEGYLDERGLCESEGPFGEFLGYYGVVKQNPVFHVTAITKRADALFQTVTIGGTAMSRTDTAQIMALRTETSAWKALQSAVREVVALNATTSAGGGFNLRIALRQRVQGEARNAIAAAHASLANIKNVFVVDPDIDVFSDEQMDWALATRFQPDRDLVISSGFRTPPLDPSLDGRRTGSKAGFDLTLPFGRTEALEFTPPAAPEFGQASFQTVPAALAEGPLHFGQIMGAIGSRDGRDVVLALDEIRQAGDLTRMKDGRWALKSQQSEKK